MRPSLVTKADEESIAIVNRAIARLQTLGATVVDPGAEGELFTGCIRRYAPELTSAAFVREHPELFPAGADQIASLVDLHADPARVPATLSLRTLNAGGFGPVGEGKYMINRYLRERGDANIRSNADLISKARFYQDPNFPDRKLAREQAERATTLDMSARLQGRFAVRTILMQCMQEQLLDALVSPMSTVPPRKLTSPDRTARSVGNRDRPAGFPLQSRWIHDGGLGSRRRRRRRRSMSVAAGRCRLHRAASREPLFKSRRRRAATHHRRPPPEFSVDLRSDQSSAGFSTWSMTTTSPVARSQLSPSCSCRGERSRVGIW
jgi:GH24 family phage-related lysozyme (muramidase)